MWTNHQGLTELSSNEIGSFPNDILFRGNAEVPHLMNTVDFQEHIGPYPVPEMYDIHTMTSKVCEQLYQLYEKQQDNDILLQYRTLHNVVLKR